MSSAIGWAGVAAVTAVSAGAAYGSGRMKANAAKKAASAQEAMYREGMSEQQRRFEDITGYLKPYTEAGSNALAQQSDYLGFNGANKQQSFIESIQKSPEFASLIQQGENAMLQNASATGGLRGGNLEAAMAQFRPQILTQLLQQRFSNLGGLANTGLSANQIQSNAAMNVGTNNATLLGQIGAAQAGALTAQGNANAAPFQAVSDLGGLYLGALIGNKDKSSDPYIPSRQPQNVVYQGRAVPNNGGLDMNDMGGW